MCQAHQNNNNPSPPPPPLSQHNDPFPWHIGVYDAHCHPTDTMDSIRFLPGMAASVLTLMATRSQDQHLVARVAASHGLDTKEQSSLLPPAAAAAGMTRVVPSFGWHPWFSHQLYDDTAPSQPPLSADNNSHAAAAAAKRAHYRAVLQPSPAEDDDDDESERFIDHLPDPVALSAFIAATRARLREHPLALVGEIGLDKAFRLPEPPQQQRQQQQQQQQQMLSAPPDDDIIEAAHDENSTATMANATTATTPGGRQGRPLSRYRVRLQHQQAVLAAQLALAAEMDRPVSLHGVQAHGALFDTVSRCWAGHELPVSRREQKRRLAEAATTFASPDDSSSTSSSSPFPPRICLHSYSGSTAALLGSWMRRDVPAVVYVSFSAAINLATDPARRRADEAIRALGPDRLLVESDLHVAGDELDASLERIYRHVCAVRGWSLEHGVARIRDNYHHFIFG